MAYTRWSEWRKWDLHVHTPLSICQHFWANTPETWEKYISDLEHLPDDFKVLWINDYLFLDWYERLLKEKTENGRLSNIDLLLPVIEFRIDKFAWVDFKDLKRINLHVIFSNEVSIETIRSQFLNTLEQSYSLESGDRWTRAITKDSLSELWAKIKATVPADKLSAYGSDLEEGFNNLNIDDNQIFKALEKDCFEGKFLIAVWKTEWDQLKWTDSSIATKKTIINQANIVFTSSESIETFKNAKNKLSEQKVNNLLLDCSDSHHFSDSGNKDRIGKCFTWIKADPTFEWLKQIIYEPEDRVYIWEKPDVLERVKNNKTKYIKSLKIGQVSWYDEKKWVWFKDQQIEFNKELVAIIWNKWNGKSAIADILGLLGNTRNFNNFSFLDSKRFHKDKLSKSFQWFLEWENGVVDNRILWDWVLWASSPEKVRYLPQSFFDTLTTELSGKDFKETLEKVIFQHLDDSLKMWKDSFDALNKYKTQSINAEIDKIKVLLVDLNKEILELEMKSLPDFLAKVENSIKEKDIELSEKRKLLEDLNKKEVKNPNDDELSKQIKSKHFEEIEKLNAILLGINTKIEEQKLLKGKLEIDKEEITTLLANFKSIEDQVVKYKLANKEKLLKYWINIDDVIKLQIDKDLLVSKLSEVNQGIQDIVQLFLPEEDLSDLEEDQRLLLRKKSLLIQKQKYLEDIEKQKQALSKPEKEYQEYLEQKNLIDLAILEIVGSIDKPNTLEYHKGIRSYINTKLQWELSILKERRLELSLLILAEKKKIIDLFKAFKEPIDKKVEDNREYLDEEYAINIDVKLSLDNNFIHNFLYYVNQSKKWSFSWKTEWEFLLKSICWEKDFYEESSIKEMLSSLLDHLSYDKREDWDNEERVPSEQISDLNSFYNYLFWLDYLDPEYELKSWKKSLEALSPWEKWTLLLIFYLLIDKEWIPLIIDQPEDNLDNQSVFKMLTRFIKMAKKQRQIIIVTHNPNLAVGADAEQIIYVKIDKEDGNNTFSFESGSIENNGINRITVDILEWTMPAFDKRRLKYKRK